MHDKDTFSIQGQTGCSIFSRSWYHCEMGSKYLLHPHNAMNTHIFHTFLLIILTPIQFSYNASVLFVHFPTVNTAYNNLSSCVLLRGAFRAQQWVKFSTGADDGRPPSHSSPHEGREEKAREREGGLTHSLKTQCTEADRSRD